MLSSAFFKKNMLLFTLLIVLLLLKFFTSGKSNISRVDDYLYIRSSFFYSNGLPDSLSHRVYRNKEDSLRMKFYNENKGYDAGFSILNLGAFTRENNKIHHYFFSLHNFYYKDHWSTYFRKDGKKYFIHQNKAIPTSLDIVENPKEPDLTLLIPVSHTVYQVITAALYLAAFVILVFFFHLSVYLPLRILFKISNGQPFHHENISSLFKIGNLFITFGIVFIIIRIVSHLVVGNMLPSIISYSYFDAFMESWELLITGLIALIVARAFEKGAKLQDEQELTV